MMRKQLLAALALLLIALVFAQTAAGGPRGVNLLAVSSGRLLDGGEADHWRRAISPACPGELTLGPEWTAGSGLYLAAVGWDGGTTACLALARAERDGGVSVTATSM